MSAPCRLASRYQPCRRVGVPAFLEEFLAVANGIGRLGSDRIPAALSSAAARRVVADAGHETKGLRFLSADHPARERELLEHVEANHVANGLRQSHVRDQTPLDFHHRQLRVSRGVAHVGAEGDLQATAVGDAVQRRDHRHRQTLPDHRRALRMVLGELVARRQRIGAATNGVGRGRALSHALEGAKSRGLRRNRVRCPTGPPRARSDLPRATRRPR